MTWSSRSRNCGTSFSEHALGGRAGLRPRLCRGRAHGGDEGVRAARRCPARAAAGPAGPARPAGPAHAGEAVIAALSSPQLRSHRSGACPSGLGAARPGGPPGVSAPARASQRSDGNSGSLSPRRRSGRRALRPTEAGHVAVPRVAARHPTVRAAPAPRRRTGGRRRCSPPGPPSGGWWRPRGRGRRAGTPRCETRWRGCPSRFCVGVGPVQVAEAAGQHATVEALLQVLVAPARVDHRLDQPLGQRRVATMCSRRERTRPANSGTSAGS